MVAGYGLAFVALIVVITVIELALKGKLWVSEAAVPAQAATVEAQPSHGIEVVERDGQWFPAGSLPELPDKAPNGEMWCHYSYTNAQEWRRCNLIPDEVAVRVTGRWERQKIGATWPDDKPPIPIRNGTLLQGPSILMTHEEYLNYLKTAEEKK